MKEIDKVCQEILKDIKLSSEPRSQPSATEAIARLERKIRNAEQARTHVISKILLRYELFPELAIRILSYEILDGMEIKDLEIILSSFNVDELEIAQKLSKL